MSWETVWIETEAGGTKLTDCICLRMEVQKQVGDCARLQKFVHIYVI